MKTLLFRYGRTVALTLDGVDVQHDGVVNVLDLAEGVNQGLQVVAVVYVPVVKAQRLEEVAAARAVALAQGLQVAVEAAVVLGNGHLVVVDDDNQVRALLGYVVQALVGLAAAE
ncbi:unknown [Prevotella sp. CAG:617]|nr:unknown [Prevotella sp. CAG:617]